MGNQGIHGKVRWSVQLGVLDRGQPLALGQSHARLTLASTILFRWYVGRLVLLDASDKARAIGCFGGLPCAETTVRYPEEPQGRHGIHTSAIPFSASLQNCIRMFPIIGFDTDSWTVANSIWISISIQQRILWKTSVAHRRLSERRSRPGTPEGRTAR